MKVLNYKKKLRLLDSINPTKNKLDNKMINLINVEF